MSDSILIRLRHHAQDERNTAFARSTMREAIDELARVTAALEEAAERMGKSCRPAYAAAIRALKEK